MTVSRKIEMIEAQIFIDARKINIDFECMLYFKKGNF